MTALLVALGAAVGAPLRYLVGQAVKDHWGTLVVNIAGSFALGLVLGLPLSPGLVAMLGTGFCGALTTYSTFSWEILTLSQRGEIARAVGYALLSITAGMGAAVLGGALAHTFVS